MSVELSAPSSPTLQTTWCLSLTMPREQQSQRRCRRYD
ncbi:unnamed protein product [Brassica oleracea]